MKISAFTLTTNTTGFGYPFIESIKSWLPAVDELIVVDGGSTDGTLEKIKEIGDNKIRIISDENTKWEDEWLYSRMGKNFNRGFKECSGDIKIKFDADYILHEDAYLSKDKDQNLRAICKEAFENGDLIISFVRFNFCLVDRYFFKKEKTLGTNLNGVKKRNVPVAYGLDLGRWAWGYEPVVPEFEKNDLIFGPLLKLRGNVKFANIKVFNYGFSFSTKEQIAKIRQRHILAETREQLRNNKVPKFSLSVLKDTETGFNEFMKESIDNFRKPQNEIKIKEHPGIIQERIKELTPEQAGYNLFGKLETSKYYI